MSHFRNEQVEYNFVTKKTESYHCIFLLAFQSAQLQLLKLSLTFIYISGRG